MGDDLSRLRATMSDLAEHGGSTDLYQRTLTGSRRLGRRRAIMTTSAAAVAVLAIAVPIALAQQQGSAPLPTATLPPAPAASPSPSLSPSVPASRPASHPPSTPPSSSTSTSHTPAHAANGCPVRTSTLTKVAGLDNGWKLDSSSIKCKQNWATSALIAPTVEQQGDGVMFFKYSPTTGKWTNKGEGSSVTCSDMGIPPSTGFCTTD
ncbi:hypothetical protein [Actinoplanes palleronii]|uniref:Uncharacterized protein n=1 Tax=Actinoplanes palleronii TaxID=113570 RepID=A0ABQ4BE52_9ACTN|nr:hypothetical protein [Actinoplanes palleronii]GIE68975.1 hypothetical protein Apa02nite_050830 [Actinoplanes palleronii]